MTNTTQPHSQAELLQHQSFTASGKLAKSSLNVLAFRRSRNCSVSSLPASSSLSSSAAPSASSAIAA
eukprot:6040255-Alexandrium_andersonii.AAC.1